MIDARAVQAIVNDNVALQLGKLLIERINADAHVQVMQARITELEAAAAPDPEALTR